MTDRGPRRLAHRGHVLVHGVLYTNRRDSVQVRRQVLATFQRGTRVYQTGSGLVSVWAEPRRLPVPLATGAPLVRYAALLSSVPLTARELEHCCLDRPALVEASASRLSCSELEAELEVDPSDWLSVDDFAVAKTVVLTARPRLPAEAVPPAAPSSREALGGIVGEAPAEQARLAEALARRETAAAGRPGAFGAALETLVAVGSRVAGALGRALTAFRGSARPDPDAALGDGSSAPRARSWFRAVSAWLRRWLWRGQVGRWLGQSHARYLARLFGMFERGDFDEALRHAIPASKSAQGDATLALLPPSARASLELGGRRAQGGSVGLGGELFEYLRQIYRRAFRELERRGELLKAAFVLSELLQEDAEAVSFLERHGMLTEAAKLAEARGLASGLVVRQWFIAGDRDRALTIARRDGAFGDALARLGHAPELASALRLLWADHLAQSGDFAGAVQVAAQLGDAGALPLGWLRRAVQVGGVVRARSLAWWARHRPESFAEVEPVAHELLDDRSLEWATARLALAAALADAPGRDTAERRALLRGVTRAVIEDRARGFNRLERGTLERWSRASEDGALHADLPGLPPLGELPKLETQELRTLVIAAADAGVTCLHDAVLLDDGRWLLATGEAGVVLLGRNLRQVHHFDVPATALVVSQHGDRVLALAKRDTVTRVARIDVTGRRCQHWAELEIGAYARRFDGAAWYAAIGSHVHALDVIPDAPRTLWRSAEVEGNVFALEVNGAALCFATDNGECWVHDLSPHRLRRRAPCSIDSLITPTGPAAEVSLEESASGPVWLLSLSGEDRVNATVLQDDLHLTEQRGALASKAWLLLGFRASVNRVELRLLTRERAKHVLTVVLEGASDFHARLDDERLVVCDDRGRLLAFDLNSGATIADARL